MKEGMFPGKPYNEDPRSARIERPESPPKIETGLEGVQSKGKEIEIKLDGIAEHIKDIEDREQEIEKAGKLNPDQRKKLRNKLKQLKEEYDEANKIYKDGVGELSDMSKGHNN